MGWHKKLITSVYIEQFLSVNISPPCGWCNKTFFGGNLESLDFPWGQNSKNKWTVFEYCFAYTLHNFHILVQVQTLEQTLFKILILGKSRFPPKKFYNIDSCYKCVFLRVLVSGLWASIIYRALKIYLCLWIWMHRVLLMSLPSLLAHLFISRFAIKWVILIWSMCSLCGLLLIWYVFSCH